MSTAGGAEGYPPAQQAERAAMPCRGHLCTLGSRGRGSLWARTLWGFQCRAWSAGSPWRPCSPEGRDKANPFLGGWTLLRDLGPCCPAVVDELSDLDGDFHLLWSGDSARVPGG